MRAGSLLALAALSSALLSPSALAQPMDEVRRSFQAPPDDSRVLMRWWWFGPAVTKPELEREMRLMKEGGIGGFEVQPVYPVALDDAATGIKNAPFLSDEFIDALRFVSDKGRELGLRVDLTLGSGWPFGGPRVSIGQAAGKLRVERVKVPENARRVPTPDIGAGEKWSARSWLPPRGNRSSRRASARWPTSRTAWFAFQQLSPVRTSSCSSSPAEPE